jgi:hypothetical protein
MTGCGANVVGPFARWRYQLQIQRPLLIEPANPGLPAPMTGDPAPCDPNRCAVRHSRNPHTLPQDPVGLPAHPNFHPVPVCPVFGPVSYGGSPHNGQIMEDMEEIKVRPPQAMPPADGLQEMPAPPATNPPTVPPDAQTSNARSRKRAATNDLRADRAVPILYREPIEVPTEANVRFVDGQE